MCGSFNFKRLHQGYLSVVRLLGAFNNFIRNDEYVCEWRGCFFFLKYNIGEQGVRLVLFFNKKKVGNHNSRNFVA